MRLALLATVALAAVAAPVAAAAPLPHVRPPPSQRKFNSTAVDALITDFSSRMLDSDLATLFSNCYPNTLDTTVQYFAPASSSGGPASFLITGDIDAQWFRDSANQLLPYVPLAPKDPLLAQLICGLVRRHAQDVAHDPFANAFNFNASGAGHQDDHRTPAMSAQVFEGKYELDSLAAVLKLAAAYYNATNDATCFLHDPSWSASMTTLVNTIQTMQAPTSTPDASPYLFQRQAWSALDTLQLGGLGSPTAYTGMSRSAFRPSDDATTFQFLIPAQAMAVVELHNLAKMIGTFLEQEAEGGAAKGAHSQGKQTHGLSRAHLSELFQLATNAASVARDIDAGIQKFGLVPAPPSVHADGAAASPMMFAYEVDGFGGVNLMDDANVPSLLSLPYLGYLSPSDPLYLATRKFVWSSSQPFWWSGSAGEGIGGPHAGVGQVWPMSLVQYAMTSSDDKEILWALDTLKASSAGTGFLHESFNVNDVTVYTRPWFAWVNALFGELVIKIANERPHLIFKQ